MSRTVVADGAAEDLIRAFTQLACTEGHLKTLIEKYNSRLTEGVADVTDDVEREDLIERINDTLDELDQVSELRRGVMIKLMDMYEDADRDFWCVVKHTAVGVYNLFEAYQATGDAEVLNLYLESNARLVKMLTLWLGVEITTCASCFSDILNGRRGGEEYDES